MKQPSTLSAVADDILNAILDAPKRQRRLLSKTFWERFGFRARTKERIEAVRAALVERHIRVIEPQPTSWGQRSGQLGDPCALSEADSGEPAAGAATSVTPARPHDSWFDRIESRVFESEREVEHYFAFPYWRRSVR